ncbi:hypothetical protein RIF29_30489 [Crotalaria pallida]|uniref:Uncharacterized protein n=1 Tax=Crotalaria pallida TaxID=3830 RepID=A0AAN9HUQ0_CROPI
MRATFHRRLSLSPSLFYSVRSVSLSLRSMISNTKQPPTATSDESYFSPSPLPFPFSFLFSQICFPFPPIHDQQHETTATSDESYFSPSPLPFPFSFLFSQIRFPFPPIHDQQHETTANRHL